METKKDYSEKLENEIKRKLEIIKKDINDYQTNYYDKLLYGEYKEILQDIAQKSSNFMEMLKYANAEVIEKIVKYKIYNSSPYSLSIYSGEKSWFYTESNSYSISDHWNFVSREKWHKLTTMPVDEAIKIKFEKKYKNSNDYYLLCQYSKDNKSYITGNRDKIAEVGAWKVIDIWEKDFEKYKTLNEINNILYELSEKKVKYETDLQYVKYGVSSFDEYKKLAKKQLKKKFEQISEKLREKIASGEITGKIYKKEYSRSRGRFRYLGEKIYEGKIDFYGGGVMTINGVSCKDFVFIFKNLAEKEKSVLLYNYLSDETGTVGYNGKFRFNK